ncbi:hypothetical protein FB446DRAFT_655499, partial [Lentinula raphanica]
TPGPITDCKERIVSVLCGKPGDKSYDEAASRVHHQMAEAYRSDQDHKRGAFPACNAGVSMGMGNSRPVRLKPKGLKGFVDGVMKDKDMRRIVGYHNQAFKTWAPRLFEKYQNVRDTVRAKTGLADNFENSVWMASGFNLGGNVWTWKHRDPLNWACGWCSITALGDFDPTRSGQLVLWELELVIDFPAGSTIMIPSACITHSNTPIVEGDCRTSFTQYSAGAIFRWVENGCRTEKEYKEQDPKGFAKMMKAKGNALERRLENFSTMTELLDVIQ